MDNVTKLKFRNLKKDSKGFEIISLEDFFDGSNNSFIGEQFRTDFYNLIFVTSGTSIHEVDFVEHVVKSGEILVISNNRIHKYCDFDGVRGYLIMFTEGFFCEYLSHNSDEVKNLLSDTYLKPHIVGLDIYSTVLDKLLDTINYSYKNLSHSVMHELVASNFKTLAQLIMNIKEKEEKFRNIDNQIFTQFTKLVEDNLSSEKTVEGYAKMLHVSKKTVNLMTRRAIDISAKQYIISQIILKIKLKLCFEELTINEIADELGFSEAANMTNFFRKYTDVSPKQFREINRNTSRDWLKIESMDLEFIRDSIEERVYLITPEVVVPMHKHMFFDEVFYCIRGFGFGVLGEEEVKIEVGDTFTVHAGKEHSLRSEGELYVLSILVPVLIN